MASSSRTLGRRHPRASTSLASVDTGRSPRPWPVDGSHCPVSGLGARGRASTPVGRGRRLLGRRRPTTAHGRHAAVPSAVGARTRSRADGRSAARAVALEEGWDVYNGESRQPAAAPRPRPAAAARARRLAGCVECRAAARCASRPPRPRPSCSSSESRSWRRHTCGSALSSWASASARARACPAARRGRPARSAAPRRRRPRGRSGPGPSPGRRRPAAAAGPCRRRSAGHPSAGRRPPAWRRRRPRGGRTRARARGRPRRRTPRSRRSPACPAAAGSDPSARRRPPATWLPCSVPTALRSAPAQKVPPAPYSTATLVLVVGVEGPEGVGQGLRGAGRRRRCGRGAVEDHRRHRAVALDAYGRGSLAMTATLAFVGGPGPARRRPTNGRKVRWPRELPGPDGHVRSMNELSGTARDGGPRAGEGGAGVGGGRARRAVHDHERAGISHDERLRALARRATAGALDGALGRSSAAPSVPPASRLAARSSLGGGITVLAIGGTLAASASSAHKAAAEPDRGSDLSLALGLGLLA